MTIFYVPQSHPICPANQTDQPSLLCNDGPLTCPDALSRPACVYQQIVQLFTAFSRMRDLYHLSLEIDPMNWKRSRLELFVYQRGKLMSYDWLANCEVYGQAMIWIGGRE